MTERSPAQVRHDICLMEQPRIWGGYALVTSGLGYLPQRGADDAHRYVELLAHVERPDLRVMDVLTEVARLVHARPAGREPLFAPKPLYLAAPAAHVPHAVLSPSGTIELEDRTVSLISVIPVTQREFACLNPSNVRDWLEKNAASISRSDELLRRWEQVRMPALSGAYPGCAKHHDVA